jgi:hypothetical protein
MKKIAELFCVQGYGVAVTGGASGLGSPLLKRGRATARA